MTKQYQVYFLRGNETIEIGSQPMPEINHGEALVKLHSVNFCPTDLKKYYHLDPISAESLSEAPVILGHEGAGVVVAIGEDVKDICVGDRVAIDPMLPCGSCPYCKTGDFPMCLNLRGLGVSAGSISESQSLMTHGFGGMFAEYVKAPAKNLFVLPEEMDFSTGSMMEPLADVLHSIEAGAPQEDESVVVIGLGAMGLMHVQVLQIKGVKKIIGIDPIADRREKAHSLGAFKTIDPFDKDPVSEVKNVTEGLGAHLVFICAGGNAQTEVTKQALQSVRKMGRIMLYASALKPADIPVDINHIHYNMIKLSGTVGFYPHHGNAALDLLNEGKMKLDVIRTPVIPFSNLQEAFTLSLQSDVTKVGINIENA
jgi:L-iditol 2-dehydrogenase